MPDDQRGKDEDTQDDRTDDNNTSPSSDDKEQGRDYAAEATDPSGDTASGGGEQPA